MHRRSTLMMLLLAISLTLTVVGSVWAQTPPPIPPNPNAQPIPTVGPAAATVAGGKVLLNDGVILDPQTAATGCTDVNRLNYSRDSLWFVVLLNCFSGYNQAFVFSADGAQKRPVTGPGDFVGSDKILWSPDSRSLLYERINQAGGATPDGPPEAGLVRYDVQTGVKLLALARTRFDTAAWSPDSRYLAFTQINREVNATHIFLLRADGSGLWELESVATTDAGAILSWEPNTSGQTSLTYVSAQATTEVDYRISEQPASSLGADWQPVPPLSPYYVTAVASDDVLNMRSGPGINFGIVYTIPPDAGDVLLTGQAQDVGASHWIGVTFAGAQGWVNRKFLLPELPADAAQPISVRMASRG